MGWRDEKKAQDGWGQTLTYLFGQLDVDGTLESRDLDLCSSLAPHHRTQSLREHRGPEDIHRKCLLKPVSFDLFDRSLRAWSRLTIAENSRDVVQCVHSLVRSGDVRNQPFYRGLILYVKGHNFYLVKTFRDAVEFIRFRSAACDDGCIWDTLVSQSESPQSLREYSHPWSRQVFWQTEDRFP